jgi:hypothetical protein
LVRWDATRNAVQFANANSTKAFPFSKHENRIVPIGRAYADIR